MHVMRVVVGAETPIMVGNDGTSRGPNNTWVAMLIVAHILLNRSRPASTGQAAFFFLLGG